MLSTNYTFTNPIYLMNMYKQDLALNKLQGLIYDKIQPTNLVLLIFFRGRFLRFPIYTAI